jgi:hypothetical protein
VKSREKVNATSKITNMCEMSDLNADKVVEGRQHFQDTG